MKMKKLLIGASAALMGLGCVGVLANHTRINGVDAKSKQYPCTFDSTTVYTVNGQDVDGYGSVNGFVTADGGNMYIEGSGVKKSADNFIEFQQDGYLMNIGQEHPFQGILSIVIKGTGSFEFGTFLDSSTKKCDSHYVLDLSGDEDKIDFGVPTNYFVMQAIEGSATIEYMKFICKCSETTDFADTTLYPTVINSNANFGYVSSTLGTCDSYEAFRFTPNRWSEGSCYMGFEFGTSLVASNFVYHFDVKVTGNPTSCKIGIVKDGSSIVEEELTEITSNDAWFHVDKAFVTGEEIDEVRFIITGTKGQSYMYIDNFSISMAK